MRTLTFYSYKGGVGRTLALANVARYLATLGQKVFTLDLDLEAPGLHYKLLSREESAKLEVGVVDYLHSFYAGGATSASLADHVVRVRHRTESSGVIDLMPAGRVPSGRYWEKLSQINWHDLFYAPGARGIPFFLELKERIATEYAPDYLLIDARTGITEIGGVATTLLPDQVVCLLVNNPENLEGARAVLRSIRRSPRLPGQASVEILPALTRIPKGIEEDTEKNLLAEVRAFLNEPGEDLAETIEVPEVFVLHSEPELQIKESLHIGSEKTPDESPLLQDYLRLFTRMIPRETIEPKIGTLLGDVLARVLDDPDGTQRALETLTTFYPHPEAYRALLKFYRVRRMDEATILRTAHRYWCSFHDDREPLLWEVVSHSQLKPIESLDAAQAEFIEAVWTTHGASDVRIGSVLSRLYLRRKDSERALEVLRTLVERTATDDAAVEYVRVLLEAKHPNEASSFAREWSYAHNLSKEFIIAWEDAVAASQSQSEARALLESSNSAVQKWLRRSELNKSRLLLLATPQEEAVPEVEALVEAEVSRGRPSRQLNDLARMYFETGRFDRFRRLLLKHSKNQPSSELSEYTRYLLDKYTKRRRGFSGD